MSNSNDKKCNDNGNIHRVTFRLSDNEYSKFLSIKEKLQRSTGNDTIKDLIKMFDRYEDLIKENNNLKNEISVANNFIIELKNNYRLARRYYKSVFKLLSINN